MIMKPNGWENVKEAELTGGVKKLPVGAYVCRIQKAQVEDNRLTISFDIAEGEYKDYYNDLYAADAQQPGRELRWRGTIRYWLPKNDGSEKDEWTKRTLKSLFGALSRSNHGYSFEATWDENTMGGKTVGILYRNEEWDYNGKHGWTARPFRVIDAERVRTGEYTLPNDRPLKGDANDTAFIPAPSQAVTAQATFTAVTDDDLPF